MLSTSQRDEGATATREPSVLKRMEGSRASFQWINGVLRRGWDSWYEEVTTGLGNMILLVTLARVVSVEWWGWNFEYQWAEERIGGEKVVMAGQAWQDRLTLTDLKNLAAMRTEHPESNWEEMMSEETFFFFKLGP